MSPAEKHQSARTARMDKVAGPQLAPSLGELYLTVPLEDAMKAHNRRTVYLRFQLSTVLHQAGITSAIQAEIFDQAQLWYCFGQEKHAEVEGGNLTHIYQGFRHPSVSDMRGTLCVVRIAGVSHDQGWADIMSQNRNSTVDSWTWVDVHLNRPFFETHRAYTNRQANNSFAYYQKDFDSSSQLVRQWDPGMAFVTCLRAVYPGWRMFAKWGCIITFHAL